jgi:aspartyl-tRNA(Asn)/glutamyl-tRNA(Gln) amidotransferase subunit A
MSDFEKKWSVVLSQAPVLKAYKNYVGTWEKKIGSFLEFDPNRNVDKELPEGPLKGIPFAVKDNIAVKNFKLTCGSKMLEQLVSPYTATAVENLQKAGAVVVGKTNLDEFGMGSSTDNSALGKTNNPWDLERVAGGSSGGSAAAVAAGLVPFALGSDTGGSIRQPASFCGVYGLKPTYGVVSRYGLTAYASSLEVIGVLARNTEITKKVFESMKGQDPMDHTSLDHMPSGKSVKTIGVLKNTHGALSPEVSASYEATIKRLEKAGYKLLEIDLPTLDYVVPAYYTIATAEASANLARYNGIRYGHAPLFAENPTELMKKSRHEGFGDEVKLRILLGTYVLRSGFQDQYYVRAQKIRTAIRQDVERWYSKADVLMMPVFPTPAFRHGSTDMDPFQQKQADLYTCTANLVGHPALSVPSTLENGLPVGVQFMAPPFEEDRLFQVSALLEKEFQAPEAPGYLTDWS